MLYGSTGLSSVHRSAVIDHQPNWYSLSISKEWYSLLDSMTMCSTTLTIWWHVEWIVVKQKGIQIIIIIIIRYRGWKEGGHASPQNGFSFPELNQLEIFCLWHFPFWARGFIRYSCSTISQPERAPFVYEIKTDAVVYSDSCAFLYYRRCKYPRVALSSPYYIIKIKLQAEYLIRNVH